VKRFLAFSGHNYYPCGGWDDLAGDADTLEQAVNVAKNPENGVIDWYHVIDSETGKKAAEYERDS